MKSESWMPEKWSIKSVVEDQRLMKLHDCACEMISKVSENKDLKPHECGRSTLSSKNSRLELEQGLKKPHFLHLQFCTCNNSFPRIPSRHNFCLKESPEFQTAHLTSKMSEYQHHHQEHHEWITEKNAHLVPNWILSLKKGTARFFELINAFLEFS